MLHTIGDDPETIRTLCALKLVFKDERMRAVVSDYLNPFKEALTQRKQFYRVFRNTWVKYMKFKKTLYGHQKP